MAESSEQEQIEHGIKQQRRTPKKQFGKIVLQREEKVLEQIAERCGKHTGRLNHEHTLRKTNRFPVKCAALVYQTDCRFGEQ